VELILPIAQLRKRDVSMVGGKAANLGEITCAEIPAPAGFVITVNAYEEFLEGTGVRAHLESLLIHLDVTDGTRIDVADEIRDLITNAEMPGVIASAIVNAYAEIMEGPVAVRSSATAEDLAEASFAGQQETYLNVEGDAHVLRAVQNCWASLFEARAVHYRATVGFGQLDVRMAVVVQRMVQADRSGVMFTLNPITRDDTQVVIEAAWGLGEGVVSGVLTPDMYIVDKGVGTILDCQVTPQERELARRPEPSPGLEFNEWVSVDWGRRLKKKLTDEEIRRLAEMGVRLEQHFGCPQDIEWASQRGAFYILQARPVTGLH
jgi:pyruvate, water dikinase